VRANAGDGVASGTSAAMALSPTMTRHVAD
jgi:hypothetical protein